MRSIEEPSLQNAWHLNRGHNKEGKSAINLNKLKNFAKYDLGVNLYVRPVGGLQNGLC